MKMKKNYKKPETQEIAVAAAQMICGSVDSIKISNATTSTQWSRGGGD